MPAELLAVYSPGGVSWLGLKCAIRGQKAVTPADKSTWPALITDVESCMPIYSLLSGFLS